MSWDAARLVILLVVVQRLGELALAHRNTVRLLAAGGVEHGRAHYPVIVALHAAWLATLAVAAPGPVDGGWLVVFLVLQAARVWILVSLGRFWTTRIITLPGQPLVRRGPYRWLQHPNYVVVLVEIPALALAFGLPWIALGFGVANAAVLAWRVRTEDRVLSDRRSVASG